MNLKQLQAVLVVAEVVVVIKVVVTVAVKAIEATAEEDPVAEEAVAEAVAGTKDAEVVAQPTAPRTANSLPTQYLLLVLWL
jgi:hypothetical protein